jgi:hypothetical protein
MLRRFWLAVVLGCCLTAICGEQATAAPAPGWELFGRFAPTELPPGGVGVLYLYVYNTGAAAAGPSRLVDRLPAGLEAVHSITIEGNTIEEPLGCSGSGVVTCELPEVEADELMFVRTERGTIGPLEIPVRIAEDVPGAGTNVAEVEGGGAAVRARAEVPMKSGSDTPGLGFANVDGWLTNQDGTIDTQAGSHPYDLTLTYAVNSAGVGGGKESPTGGEAHKLRVNLPPGLVGEPGAVPQCSRQQFDAGVGSSMGCPSASKVGEDFASPSGFGLLHLPVYNLIPPAGVAAQLGFTINGTSVFLDSVVRSGGDSGISEEVDPVAQYKVVFNTTIIWGTPGEASHDLQRGGPFTGAVKPFLTLPTSCGAPPRFSIEVHGTWQEEAEAAFAQGEFLWHNSLGEPVGITGCERLVHFHPALSIAPDTNNADTPAGLTARLRLNASGNPEGLATSGLRDATVVLPEGMAINPGQATGLAACQQGPGPGEDDLPRAGEDRESEIFDGPPNCPAASKVGEDEIATPLLPDRLRGNVYVLQSNPPTLKLLVAASGEGVNIKTVGTVHLNEATGQLTTVFEDIPDAPFSEFKLAFSGGAQAALVTPSICRDYTTTSAFDPWSGLEGVGLENVFAITGGPNGAPCANPLPFAPAMEAGATTDQAGGYTNFSMLLQRGDGQQRISSLQFRTPEGLLGMISKVPLCGEPQASRGECSAASQIGHTVVGAGPGPYPLFIPQAGQPPAPIYLTGPYEGAPYGLSIVVPIVAGPFTLQTQVVRARIEVDRHTSQLTVTTDPLPTIIDGVPADLRSIDAVIDRSGFMFNPTDCDRMSFSGTARSTENATAALSSPFRVGSCRSLTFKPTFTVSTSAKTSRAGGASLTAKILYPPVAPGENQATSQANIARVKVQLPKRLPSRLTTLQKACLAAVFEANPANCPPASIVGHARVITPVLPEPLSGPAYFVSHGNEAFPALTIVLQGQGITIDQEGSTFISKKGITTTTFKSVPDVPFTSFELSLPKGPHSALAANGSLCRKPLKMPTEFVAQNGAVLNRGTKIAVLGCPRRHVHGRRATGHKRGGAKTKKR